MRKSKCTYFCPVLRSSTGPLVFLHLFLLLSSFALSKFLEVSRGKLTWLPTRGQTTYVHILSHSTFCISNIGIREHFTLRSCESQDAGRANDTYEVQNLEHSNMRIPSSARELFKSTGFAEKTKCTCWLGSENRDQVRTKCEPSAVRFGLSWFSKSGPSAIF